jgi:hypothetical protein
MTLIRFKKDKKVHIQAALIGRPYCRPADKPQEVEIVQPDTSSLENYIFSQIGLKESFCMDCLAKYWRENP